jgi:hypothetical protein
MRLRGKLYDHKRILMIIGLNQIAALHRLVATALKRDASTSTIIKMLENSIETGWKP